MSDPKKPEITYTPHPMDTPARPNLEGFRLIAETRSLDTYSTNELRQILRQVPDAELAGEKANGIRLELTRREKEAAQRPPQPEEPQAAPQCEAKDLPWRK